MKLFVFYAIIVYFGQANCLFKMLLLHTNDMHARFDEVDVYSSSCPNEYKKRGMCYGGFARIKEAANRAKEEALKKEIPSIFLNAGDTFQGTPYYTLYKWRIVAPMIDSLQFDVMCLGNHEFDNGPGDVAAFLNNITTPVVAANIDKTSDESFRNVSNLTPSFVKTINGTKIGIVGYLTPATMNISSTGDVRIMNEIPSIKAEVEYLKKQGVKIIIGLGHSGFEMDQKIAKEVPGLSLIVGGHSHSLLYTPKEEQPSTEQVTETYPFFVTQDSGKRVPIVQAYAYTKYFGKLWVTFGDDGSVISAEGNPQLLDYTVGKDSKVDSAVGEWTRRLGEELKIVKGYTRVFLQKSSFLGDQFESTAGNLITDALAYTGIQKAKNRSLPYWTDSPIAIYQNGGIRCTIDNTKNQGALTVEDLLTMMPFENDISECRFRGSALKAAFEKSVHGYNPKNTNNYLPYFLSHSGLKVVYDLSKSPGDRVESIMVLCSNCAVPHYETLEYNKVYSIIINTFLMKGGDMFSMFKTERISARSLNITDTDSVMSFIENRRIVYPVIEGRIQVKGFFTPSSAVRIVSSFRWLLALSILFIFFR